MEIEDSELSYILSNLYLENDNKKAINRKDENILVELSILITIEENKVDLPPRYKFIRDEIIYSKE